MVVAVVVIVFVRVALNGTIFIAVIVVVVLWWWWW